MPGQPGEPLTRIDRSGAQLAALERYLARQRELEEGAPEAPVVGPTAALEGRAGGPGFDVGPQSLTADDYDTGSRSGWQVADGVWRDSGIRWDRPPVRLGQSDVQWQEEPPAGPVPAGPVPAAQAFASAPVFADAPPRDGTDQTVIDAVVPDFGTDQTSIDAPLPGFGAGAAGQGNDPDAFGGYAAGARTGDEPGPWRQSWEASAGPWDQLPGAYPEQGASRGAPGHGFVWQLTRVGLPVAVIVTVGAGAFIMLTGRSGEMLSMVSSHKTPAGGHGAVSGNTSAPGTPGAMAQTSAPAIPASSGKTGSGRSGSGTAGSGQNVFPGYPGQHGQVSVSSLASSGGTQLAAGAADGHPAIWRRDPSGGWTLISASQPAVYAVPGTEALTGIAHGQAGWIAVGGALSGDSPDSAGQPVVLTSDDGVTWRKISGTGAFGDGRGLRTRAVAAGPHGYVIVGQQASGGRKIAAMWWSSDLRNWTRAGNGNLDGRLAASDVYAVVATSRGFAAAGSHGVNAAMWTTPTGRSWVTAAFPPPAGASTATLLTMTVSGSRVVAAGEGMTKTGATIPFVVTSGNSGLNWHEVTLPAPGGPTSGDTARITGLSAAGTGFTVTGQLEKTGGQVPVTWSSPDGLTWSAPSAG